MSPEVKNIVSRQTQYEGIKAAAAKANKAWVTVRREDYPKRIYPTNQRISFGLGASRR